MTVIDCDNKLNAVIAYRYKPLVAVRHSICYVGYNILCIYQHIDARRVNAFRNNSGCWPARHSCLFTLLYCPDGFMLYLCVEDTLIFFFFLMSVLSLFISLNIQINIVRHVNFDIPTYIMLYTTL